MNHRAPGLPALCLALAAAAPALAAESASGTVHLTRADFTVVDGVAYRDGEMMAIALSDVLLDKSGARGENTWYAFDRLRHTGQSIAINIENGKPTMCADAIIVKDGVTDSAAICNSGLPDSIKINSLDDTRVSGTMKFITNDIDIDVRFDLTIESGGG